jgi:hypothetical protein
VTLSSVSQSNTFYVTAVVNLLYEMDRCCLYRRRCFDSHILCGRVRGLHMVLAPEQLMWTNRRAYRSCRGSGLLFSRTRQMEMTGTEVVQEP